MSTTSKSHSSYFFFFFWGAVAALISLVALMTVVLASPAQAANLVVTNTNNAGAGSLTQAILDANANAGEDTITFALGSEATITPGPHDITDSAGLTIDGGSAHITMQHSRLMVFDGAKLTLENLTVTEGTSLACGGAVYNEGTLEVINSTFTRNGAAFGGAICNNGGIIKVTNSTFWDNIAIPFVCPGGEGICNGAGGAIFIEGGNPNEDGRSEVTNSTIADNFIGNVTSGPGGGGIQSYGRLFLSNTIVADNSPANCGPGGIEDEGNNLDSDLSCFGQPTESGNPRLGRLADNGGPTQTMALLPGSPAINAGNNASALDPEGNPLQFDQRGEGFARIVGPAVDIGAFEVQGLGSQPPPAEVPEDKQACKKGGYREFGFKNQGQCIKAVNHAS